MNDPFMCCPYNKSHTVPRSILQAHIVKCQEKYPELKICPFNATHRLPEAEMKIHVRQCPAKDQVFSEDSRPKATGVLTKPKPLFQRMYLQVTDTEHEDWDDYLQQN